MSTKNLSCLCAHLNLYLANGILDKAAGEKSGDGNILMWISVAKKFNLYTSCNKEPTILTHFIVLSETYQIKILLIY